MNTFYNDKARGKRGEKLVYDALTAKGHTLIDLTEDPVAQEKDIDFEVIQKCGYHTTLEVKSDFASERTENLFIEMENMNPRAKKRAGWYYYTQCEYICFVQETARKAYIVLFDDLKKALKTNRCRTAYSSNMVGLLFPLEKLKELESYYCFTL